MKHKYFFTFLLMLFSLISFSQTLDQSYAPSSPGGGVFSVSSSANVGQTFTAGVTDDLSQINLRLINSTSSPTTTFVAGDFQLRIFEGNGYSGTLLNTTVINITSVSTSYMEQVIALSSVVPIVSGNQYTIDFRGVGSSVVGIHGVTPANYTAGDFYFSNGNTALATSYDLWFKTFVNTAAPATPATHLNFDGSNDFVSVASPFTGYTNQITVDFWINRKGNLTTGSGLGQSTPNDTNISNSVWLMHGNSNNSFSFLVNEFGTWRDSGPTSIIPLDTWTHISGVADANGIRVYVNGVLSNSSTTGISTGINSNSNAELHIGKDVRFSSGIGRDLNASIDDVRIWNSSRNAEQISNTLNCELQGNESGLVSYFKFNQGSDQANNASETTLLNSVSGATNGTLNNFALTGATSNWLAGSPVTSGSTIPGVPTVSTPVVYNQNDAATALTAATGTNGTGLLWHTVATGGTGTTTAPTPSTTTVGNTSYWVSSTNANGCESERVEIVVTVNALIPATHLNFDGSNDVINLGSNLTTSFTGKTAFTLEAWVKPETTTGLGVIVGNYDYPSTGLGMQMLLRKENSNYTLWMDNGAGFVNITQSNTVVLNTWQHIAGTWDGSVLSLYIDGVLVNSSNVSGTLPSKSTTFSIGSNGHNEAFNGAIEEVRIWDVTRTVSQINSSKNCELQGDESGLVSYFKFNQGSDQANNTSETVLSNSVSGATNGTLLNFALTGATSNWLAGSPVTSGSTIPGVPTVTTPVVYNQNDAATALTATTGTNGTGLLWYTVATGGTGTATAPTPSTTTVGNTSYWVSSTNANGCESERVEIVVTVNVSCSITDQTVTVTSSSDNCSSDVVVSLASSETGIQYYLRDNTDNSIVEGPINGTGNQIDFSSETITTSKTYNVLATDGIPNYALDFDGVNDYVSGGNIPTLPQGNNNFTIEMWLKPTSADYDNLIRWGGNSTNLANAMEILPNGVIRHYFWGNDLDTPASNLLDGNWHHIACSYNGSTRSIYLDGVVIATDTTTSPNVNGTTLIIGHHFAGRYYSGQMNDVRVWNTTRTLTEINDNMNTTNPTGSGLVVHYNFNEGTGTTVADSSGNNYNGTLINMDAASDWIELPSSCELELTNTPTVTVTNPEIDLLGNAISIADGDTTPATGDDTDFGDVNTSVSDVHTFTISNTSAETLNITSIVSSGTHAADFVVGSIPTTVATGSSETFTVTFTPSAAGSRVATITINNDDCNEAVYDFSIEGNGISLPATHLNFDGVNDFVELGTSIPVIFNGFSTFTVEAQVYNNNVSGFAAYVGNHGTGGTTQFSLRRINDVYQILFSDSGSILALDTPSGTALSNTWQHVTATINGNLVSIYIDGVLQNTYSHTSVINFPNASGASLKIASNDFNEIHSGNIEEIRVWSSARTANQISGSKNCELQGNESGLVAYYKFNQGVDAEDNTSITTLTDATSNGNNGILTNFALTGASSNWLAGSPVTTGSIVPSEAGVTTPVMYNEGDSASPLTATVGANGTGLMWYTTETGGLGSTTAPTPDTTTTGSTSYFVSSTNANGCESNREEIVVTVNEVLSTNDFSLSQEFKLYPNPTVNNVSITFSQLDKVAIQVYDLGGRVLISKKEVKSNETISLSNLSTGIYLFKIMTSKGEIVKRIIKK